MVTGQQEKGRREKREGENEAAGKGVVKGFNFFVGEFVVGGVSVN